MSNTGGASVRQGVVNAMRAIIPRNHSDSAGRDRTGSRRPRGSPAVGTAQAENDSARFAGTLLGSLASEARRPFLRLLLRSADVLRAMVALRRELSPSVKRSGRHIGRQSERALVGLGGSIVTPGAAYSAMAFRNSARLDCRVLTTRRVRGHTALE